MLFAGTCAISSILVFTQTDCGHYDLLTYDNPDCVSAMNQDYAVQRLTDAVLRGPDCTNLDMRGGGMSDHEEDVKGAHFHSFIYKNHLQMVGFSGAAKLNLADKLLKKYLDDGIDSVFIKWQRGQLDDAAFQLPLATLASDDVLINAIRAVATDLGMAAGHIAVAAFDCPKQDWHNVVAVGVGHNASDAKRMAAYSLTNAASGLEIGFLFGQGTVHDLDSPEATSKVKLIPRLGKTSDKGIAGTKKKVELSSSSSSQVGQGASADGLPVSTPIHRLPKGYEHLPLPPSLPRSVDPIVAPGQLPGSGIPKIVPRGSVKLDLQRPKVVLKPRNRSRSPTWDRGGQISLSQTTLGYTFLDDQDNGKPSPQRIFLPDSPCLNAFGRIMAWVSFAMMMLIMILGPGAVQVQVVLATVGHAIAGNCQFRILMLELQFWSLCAVQRGNEWLRNWALYSQNSCSDDVQYKYCLLSVSYTHLTLPTKRIV